jgi:Icc-related predicted phosphoesterase
MIIVALPDIHDDVGRLGTVAEDLSAADLVLLVGDLTNFGRQAAAERIVRAVRKYNSHILAVPGNCDYPEVDAFLTSEGINLHRRSTLIDGIAFLGVGGSLPCPGRTPNEYSDRDFEAFLAEAASDLRPDAPVILVSHQPPRNTVNDLAGIGRHVGSESVRAFVRAPCGREVMPMRGSAGIMQRSRYGPRLREGVERRPLDVSSGNEQLNVRIGRDC